MVNYLSNVQGAKQYDIVDINVRKNTVVVAKFCFKQFSIWKNRKIALVSHLTPKQYIAVAKLVVKKCKVSCTLDGIPVKGLWLLGDEAQLNLVGANEGRYHLRDG